MRKTQTFIKRALNSISSDILTKTLKNSIKNRITNKQKDNSINITQKINYKNYGKYQKVQMNLSSLDDNKNNLEKQKYYWFAAYDKLIKEKKLFKIFSFYNINSKNSISLGNINLYNDFDKIKEKKMTIKNYEIYFIKNMNTKPFIRYSEGKLIHTKLYLLTLKQINMIFSYLNKIEYNDYFNSLGNIKEKEKDKYINNLYKKHININIDYPTIYFLGSFLNIGIYTFTKIGNENNSLNSNNIIELDYFPNSKKIAKLIKILLINFPEYSKEYFINYIFSYMKNIPNKEEINEKILSAKKYEINNLLISQKKSLYKNNTKINSGKGNENGNLPLSILSSPYLSSFNNNNKLNTNNNTNNNMIKNINNNLGTISYNASYFDFTSDYILSLRQNKENLSKYINSIRNLSHRNKSENKNNLSLSLSNKNKNIYLKNILNNSKKMKQKSSNINNINKKNDMYRISNFSFENDSMINKNDYIKIKVNRKANEVKRKTKQTKKEHITNIENCNKENYNSASNFCNININDMKKNASINNKTIINFNSQKNYLKGENIFPNTDNFNKKNNSPFMYILDNNGVNSYHSKNFRRNKGIKINNNCILRKS